MPKDRPSRARRRDQRGDGATYWPKRNPIGQRVQLAILRIAARRRRMRLVTIVGGYFGVVGDVRNDGLRKPVLPQVYVPYTLRALGAGLLLVRTPGSPGGIYGRP